MKKIYKKPSAEVVNIKLISSILDDPDPGVGAYSNVTYEGDAKEGNFDDFNSEEDIWGGQSIQMKDVWER